MNQPDYNALCRADGRLIFSQKDFLKAEGKILGVTLLAWLLFRAVLSTSGLMTHGLSLALLFMLCGLVHWGGGLIVSDKVLHRAAALLLKAYPELEDTDRILLLRASVAFKGCYIPGRMRAALIKQGYTHTGVQFDDTLLAELAELEKTRSMVWLALPVLLLIPGTIFTYL